MTGTIRSRSADTPPESLAHALADLLAHASVEAGLDVDIVAQAASTALSPFELFSAGAPEHSAQVVERLESLVANCALKKERVPRKLESELSHWRKTLTVALKAQVIKTERQARFPGCWCFGFGGKDRSRAIVAYDEQGRRVTESDAPATFYSYCHCPDGQQAESDAETYRREMLERARQRRVARRWGNARLPDSLAERTLEGHPDQVAIAKIRAWYGGLHRPGLILAGPNQRGKTTAGYLIARQALEDNQSVICRTVPDLLGALINTFRDDGRWDELPTDERDPTRPSTHQQMIGALQEVDFLMLDDLGSEKASDYVETTFYRVLNARLEQNRLTLITTNLTRAELIERFGVRLWARLAAHCKRVLFEGPPIGPAADGLVDIENLVLDSSASNATSTSERRRHRDQ